jgi:hypothetical protein
MSRAVTSGLAALCVGVLGLSALAAAALAQQAPPPEEQVLGANRVTVRRMIPPPDVGPGAPYHAPEEIEAIARGASREASDANADSRTAGRSDDCKDTVADMNTPGGVDPLARISMNAPRLQGLYRDRKSQATRVSQLAGKALDATNKAEEARLDAANGAYDKARVEKTELDRQKAVNELEKARTKLQEMQARIADYGDLRMRRDDDVVQWMDLDMKALARKKAAAEHKGGKPTNIIIAAVESGEFQDGDGFYIAIAGVLVNTGNRSEKIPEFVITVHDTKGFPLRNEYGSPQARSSLPPGGQLPFRYILRPSPQYVGKVTVNFATGKEPPPEMPVGLLCQPSPPPVPAPE